MLILGGGFAGAYVARLLGARGATIVSLENFMLYTPMLPEAASGTLEPRHTVVPLRVMCPHAELLLGEVTGVDLEARDREVETDVGTQTVRWRELVLALGAVPRTLPVPGLAEHGLSFKSLADAIHLRNHVCASSRRADARSTSERARAAHVRLRRRGYAGVEALAELSDLVEDALRYYPRLRCVPRRWVLVDAAPKILPEIPSRLGDYAARELEQRGVEITSARRSSRSRRTGSCSATARASRRGHSSGPPASRRTRSCASSALPARRARARRGRRAHARARPRARLVARRLRTRAEHAQRPSPIRRRASTRSARRAGSRRTSQGDPQPYGYRMLGQVATLGRYKGIADVLGVRLRGFPGWFVTRSYHLYQLPLALAKAPRRRRLDDVRCSSGATSRSSGRSAIPRARP